MKNVYFMWVHSSVSFTRFPSEFIGGTTKNFNDSCNYSYKRKKLQQAENYKKKNIQQDQR